MLPKDKAQGSILFLLLISRSSISYSVVYPSFWRPGRVIAMAAPNTNYDFFFKITVINWIPFYLTQ